MQALQIIQLGVYAAQRTAEKVVIENFAVLIRQDPGNRCKLSLRSSGSDDVRSVAALFGGGGHLNAAGATIDDADMDAVTRQTIKAIQDITFGEGKEEKR